MSRIARGRVAVTAMVFAGLVMSVGLIVWDRPRLEAAVFVLGGLQLANSAAQRWLRRRGDVKTADPQAAYLVAGLLAVRPSAVPLALGLGVLVGQALAGRKPMQILWNFGQRCVGVSLGVAVAMLLGADGTFSWPHVGAALAGLVVTIAANDMQFASYFKWVDGEAIIPWLRTSLSVSARRLPVLAAVGVLAAASFESSPWAAVFGVLPIAGMQIALADHDRAMVDRERLRGLFEAANSAHSSVQLDEVCGSLAASAARMLHCERAKVVDRAPTQPGQFGVALGGELTGEWLVIEGRHTGERLDAEEADLLEALAAVGASAIENAKLVQQIQHQAVHDPVTGLANQVLFEDRVAQSVAASRRSGERFVVMVLDLDAFKKVNDSLGHSKGNELLRLVADRLSGSVREIDTVARLGSDHFTLLLPGVSDADESAVMAEKILAAIRRPISLGGHELFMTASAGLAFFPEDGTRPEHLLRNADGAMHRAKEMGRDTFQVYASGMNEAAHMRLVRESELHQAIERDQLRLRYQPQIDLRTGRIVGVEALVRWEHPVLGLIGPHEFVPLAEESGLIVAVDTWVMRNACKQARAWHDDGLPPLRMAVNLSGRHFHANDRLLETVQAALFESGLAPDMLELEVTEGVAVGEDDTGRILQQVRELGCKLAIDDFGTGYSMLGRLQKFPIDKLKIDRSFVREIETAHGEAPIVAAMIAMARSLNIEVVAEGVETLEQQTFLRFHGCDQGQGFLFSQPVEADEISRLLRTPSVGFNVAMLS